MRAAPASSSRTAPRSGQAEPGHPRAACAGCSRPTTNADWRLRAMWALHVTGGWTPDRLAQSLEDRDEYIRAWAVQLLTEDRHPARGGRSTASPAGARGRVTGRPALPVARRCSASTRRRAGRSPTELMSHGEDADDHNLPKLIWLAVEPLVQGRARAGPRAGRRGATCPLVARFIARRAVDADAIAAGRRRNRDDAEDADQPARGPARRARGTLRPRGAAELGRGLRPAEARRCAAPSALAVEVAQQFGDTELARQHLATLRSPHQPRSTRAGARCRRSTAQRRPQLSPSSRRCSTISRCASTPSARSPPTTTSRSAGC